MSDTPMGSAARAAVGLTTLNEGGVPVVRHYEVEPEVAEQIATWLGEPDATWMLSDDQAARAADVASEAVTW